MSTAATDTARVSQARARLADVVWKTPLQYHAKLSEKHACQVFLKREDLQVVRSYKLRGAYHFMSGLTPDEQQRGIVCASAGNHAQGVAWSCRHLRMKGVIYMPSITPGQKINQVKMFGGAFVETVLVGDTFDECQAIAQAYAHEHEKVFVPAFDHPRILEGQGTVTAEILEELPDADVLFLPVGGGGLAAGAVLCRKELNHPVRLVGVEPSGAPSLTEAIRAGQPVTLDKIQRFVDGAAVRRVGTHTFELMQDSMEEVVLVPEGKVSTTILRLYNEDAIVAEPAGALTIAALDLYGGSLKGKKVVCVVSGGNNDIDRMQEIKERSLLYEGLKHYFIVRFAQRPGALKEFVNHVLGPHDDIVRFEFIQKHNKETGPALIGIEVRSKEDYNALLERMKHHRLSVTEVNQQENLFEYLV